MSEQALEDAYFQGSQDKESSLLPIIEKLRQENKDLIEQSIKSIQYELIHDSEYRDVWIANVAMSIYDTDKKGVTAHEWRQKCGEQFIKYLCAGHPDDPTSQLMESIGH